MAIFPDEMGILCLTSMEILSGCFLGSLEISKQMSGSCPQGYLKKRKKK